MSTNPRATTMPGGAPLKKPRAKRRTAAKKPPCKYGPRDADGYCPKKPPAVKSTSSGARSSSKKPCKYGPRGADGYCPKKPKAAPKAPTIRKGIGVEASTTQAIKTIRSETATSSQKKEALKQVGVAIAVDAAKGTARDVRRKMRTAKGKREVQETAKKIAKTAGTVVAAAAKRAVPVAVAGGIVYAGGKALTANRKREAKAYADRELAKTKAKVKLTAEAARTLWQQYYDWFVKQPVRNSYLGK